MTGVQTCALPICAIFNSRPFYKAPPPSLSGDVVYTVGEDGTIFAIALKLTESGIVLNGLVEMPSSITAISGAALDVTMPSPAAAGTSSSSGISINVKDPSPVVPFVMALTF